MARDKEDKEKALLEELGRAFDALPERRKQKLLGYVTREAAKEKQDLIKAIMAKLRGVDKADITFVQGVIEQTFLGKGIDLFDPLVEEVTHQIFKKLRRKRRRQ